MEDQDACPHETLLFCGLGYGVDWGFGLAVEVSVGWGLRA